MPCRLLPISFNIAGTELHAGILANLQAVLEVYRLEGDRDDLLDSVKRIARKTIDETVAAGLPGGGDE